MERSARKLIPLSPVLADFIHLLSTLLQPSLAFGNTSPFVLTPNAWDTHCKELQRSPLSLQNQRGSNAYAPRAVATHQIPLPSSQVLALPSLSPCPASCDMTRHGLLRAALCLYSSCLWTGPQLSKHLQASECPRTTLEVESQHGLSNKHALNNPGPTPAFTIEISHGTPTRAVNRATGDKVCNGDLTCPLLRT